MYAVTLLLVLGCGSSQPPAGEPQPLPPVQPRPSPPTGRHEEPLPPPAAPGAAEALLATRPDGSALVYLDAGGRRLILLGPAEVTPENEGPAVETSRHRIRLEAETALTTPRPLQLIRGDRPCAVTATRTFRAEVMAIEGDASVPAPLVLWVAEATSAAEGCGVDEESGGIAIAGSTAPAVERITVDEAAGAAARRRIPRTTQPRPPRGWAAAATIDGVTVLATTDRPDEDGCTAATAVYLLRADGTAEGYAGYLDEHLLRIGGAAYVTVVDSTTDAGRPARHVRVVPLAAGAPLLDTGLALGWMTAPNC